MTDSVTVVLADDSMTIRAMLSALLREIDEIDLVAVAEDGESAVDLVLEHRPDVVIMDMQMPGIGGLEAAARIIDSWPDARIIMNTAYGDDSLKERAEQVGAAGYITKGQRPSALIATLLETARAER